MIKRFDDRSLIGHLLPSAETGAQVQERAANIWHATEQYIANHPKRSLIVALTAGAVLGWLTKRR
jgi:ElaB/YqjD/DUF883 family membrane-anchored ribosome-binding protein